MNKTFAASLDQLHEMLDFVIDQASRVGFKDTHLTKIKLAVEETFVNIVSYGYIDRQGSIEINCHFHPTIGLKITIKDQGIPYNPLVNVKPCNFSSSLEDQNPGGLGIFLITKAMDEIDYERQDETNVLTLIKYPVKE